MNYNTKSNNDPLILITEYFYGYSYSIKKLSENLERSENVNELFFPLNFLVLQYLELFMKSIIWVCDFDYHLFTFKEMEITGHDLRKFFEDDLYVESILKLENGDVKKNRIQELYTFFSDFSTKKSISSESMRFPFGSLSNEPIIKLKKIKDTKSVVYKNNVQELIQLLNECFKEHVVRVANKSLIFQDKINKQFTSDST